MNLYIDYSEFELTCWVSRVNCTVVPTALDTLFLMALG